MFKVGYACMHSSERSEMIILYPWYSQEVSVCLKLIGHAVLRPDSPFVHIISFILSSFIAVHINKSSSDNDWWAFVSGCRRHLRRNCWSWRVAGDVIWRWTVAVCQGIYSLSLSLSSSLYISVTLFTAIGGGCTGAIGIRDPLY
jgi:hypothetical protein